MRECRRGGGASTESEEGRGRRREGEGGGGRARVGEGDLAPGWLSALAKDASKSVHTCSRDVGTHLRCRSHRRGRSLSGFATLFVAFSVSSPVLFHWFSFSTFSPLRFFFCFSFAFPLHSPVDADTLSFHPSSYPYFQLPILLSPDFFLLPLARKAAVAAEST